jgi:serine/threonine protein kinase
MDLAARNVLMHTNNLVKISDFGLARKLDDSGVYRLDKPLKLPIPWMAFESLTLKIFTVPTDVWAFGVLVWEVSLCKHAVESTCVFADVLHGCSNVDMHAW